MDVTQPTGISPRFLALLAGEDLERKRLLDVGCGWGRLSLLLARQVGDDLQAGHALITLGNVARNQTVKNSSTMQTENNGPTKLCRFLARIASHENSV